jgi:NAD-dependent SIR2 family protein deacetylase
MMLQSSNCVAYTGAGISTGAGIGDYASRSAGADSQVHKLVKRSSGSRLQARPTKAHHVLTRLYQCGILKWWCQQNHDGLPQKAGFPQHALNEIHGSWFDPANRVVKMSESLRNDLCKNMIGWQHQADLCLAVGTSLSGMAADEIVSIVSQNRKKRFTRYLTSHPHQTMTLQDLGAFGGSVIVGFQCTSHDHEAALRIYHSIDTVFEALIKVLLEETPSTNPSKPRIQEIFSQPFQDDIKYWQRQVVIGKVFATASRIHSPTMFEFIGYHPKTGKRTNVETDRVLLDLSARQTLILTCGIEKGCQGVVQGNPDAEGHIKILWTVPEIGAAAAASKKDKKASKSIPMREVTRVLGIWNIISALEGQLPILPCLNFNAESEIVPTIPTRKRKAATE